MRSTQGKDIEREEKMRNGERKRILERKMAKGFSGMAPSIFGSKLYVLIYDKKSIKNERRLNTKTRERQRESHFESVPG